MGREHLIVSVHGEINVVPVSVYHLLPDSVRWRVEIIATCPDGDKARWVQKYLPQYYNIGELMKLGDSNE